MLFIRVQAYTLIHRNKRINFDLFFEWQSSIWATYDTFVFCQLWELLFSRVGVGQQDFDDGFSETFHVSFPDFRIGAFKLWDDVKALRQLRENINDWRRKQGVLTASLELLFDPTKNKHQQR